MTVHRASERPSVRLDYRLSLICEFAFGENKQWEVHWESKIDEIERILFHFLQMLSYLRTSFETKQFMCCVIKVDGKIKYIYSFHSI